MGVSRYFPADEVMSNETACSPKAVSMARVFERLLFQAGIVLWSVEVAGFGVSWVGGLGVFSPEPAHHVGEDGAAVFLAVVADAPGVGDVVVFLFEGFG